jgi:hypothetical protein
MEIVNKHLKYLQHMEQEMECEAWVFNLYKPSQSMCKSSGSY